MGRALSVHQVLAGAHDCAVFDGEWLKNFGCPELCGSWIVWGQSFNGKTTFAMQLAKYLCRFSKVLYNSMEEGSGKSIQVALARCEMSDVARRFFLLDGEDFKDLTDRLCLRKAPRIVIMDSLQYSGLTYKDYKWLKKNFPKVLWVWISHAEGRLPEGRLANRIRYDSMVKIRVEGYRAYINSRYNAGYQGDNYLTIWAAGAKKYWGEKEVKNDNNE